MLAYPDFVAAAARPDTKTGNRRILVVDDNAAIHADVRKILCPVVSQGAVALAALEAELLGEPATNAPIAGTKFRVDSAHQGREGLALVEHALAEEEPYAMAFVDVRMPPGWDGIETARAIWQVQPDLQIVICTAYSDYSWDEILEQLGATDRLVILRKPFDAIEVLQLANALTEKWNLQRATRRYADELEERVRSRTADLEATNAALQAEIRRRAAVEADLVRAKEVAESADRAKTSFLANMSHEIRTPMNGVIGMANLLLTSDLTSEQRDCANTISQCCDSLLTIINDILDLSKIEAGRLELEQLEFNLREVVEMTVDLQREVARTKGLRIALEIGEDVPAVVQGDPVRLRQVLLNFVTNAVKFTESGGVSVRVTRGETPSAGSAALHFSVTDSGIGISPEVQRQLFQPFVQADTSTTRRYGGTGLGLAISKRIVELMGGRIGVESAAGKGATFWFDVALATGQAATQADARASDVATPMPIADLTVATAPILVAEDNPVNQKVIALMLRNLGYAFRVVTNGREALEVLREEPFSLVLMDEHMPEMDGIVATRQIREAERTGALRRNESIPIVATTADAMPGTRERCLGAGMNAYLTKPIRFDALARTLAEFLSTVPSA